MVARSLARRMEELERQTCGAKKWHVIIRHADQTEEDAIAAYEADNGPIGPDDGSMLWVIVRKPTPRPAAPYAA